MRQPPAMFEIDERQKADILSRAETLILPSYAEASPYVALEATASGTPHVVSFAVPEEVIVEMYQSGYTQTHSATVKNV